MTSISPLPQQVRVGVGSRQPQLPMTRDISRMKRYVLGRCNGEATSPVWLMLIEPVCLTSTV